MKTSKPRIAMISEHASPLALLGGEDAGGQNVYVSEVSSKVAALGYEVDVFTRRDSSSVPEVTPWAEGVRVVSLKAGPLMPLKKDLLLPHMPEFRDNLIHFAKRDGVAYDLIHGNFWMSGWVGCELRESWGIPLVETFHALGKIKKMHQGAADTSPVERSAVELRVIAEADVLIAQCPSEKEELIELYGAEEDDIVIVPSAVDVDTFHPVPRRMARKMVGLEPDGPIIAYVGRLLPRKGIDCIVQALARLSEGRSKAAQLVIVGGETDTVSPETDKEVARLTDIAASLGVLDRVSFVGRRPQSVLKYYYSAADVCVSTPWYEPFGLVPLESMACGTPMIASEVGGMKFTVQDNRTGFHVPPKDPGLLAARIELVLNSPGLRASMGRKARERVEKYFTWHQVAKRMAGVYGDLIEWKLETGLEGRTLLEGATPMAPTALPHERGALA
ncbi:MAG: glycosyltransferase family 1 protein [Chloroflexi bacterium]|nr:glycosyltransferase family 1 protein [Chloroflexota bacterium]